MNEVERPGRHDGPAPAAGPTATRGHEAAPPPLVPEDAEWAAELTRSWVEVYKKSATTLVLLRILREHGALSAGAIAPLFTEATGWSITERGLYRTLRRLADTGVLAIEKVDVARTGAKRQDFLLTPVGAVYLAGIESEVAWIQETIGVTRAPGRR